ncbi:hypothetical protein Tco_1260280 [Tanacetum coccineum]
MVQFMSKALNFEPLRRRERRPTAHEVVIQLKKALEFQEDHEKWEPKLPKDYKEMIQMSKCPEIYSTIKKEDLYNIFSKGILLQQHKVVISSFSYRGYVVFLVAQV